MGTAITPQLADTIDHAQSIRHYSSGNSRRLRLCRAERWGLRAECPTPEDPFHASETTWLLPAIGIRLTRQQPRSIHSPGASVLTAVRIRVDGTRWYSADLLLGLAVPAGCAARIARSEEFAAAVASGLIRGTDADFALRTVHRTLDELCRCRHDVSSWLAAHRVFEVWPPM
ncbi:DUF402 domain-containing protein [Tamaricihabitans halophyticus]|uniref:DUF402 domain-containing protein n=1 Tax=Tamaricihabitans halophyticus TaxID=1262583 RepID=UPI0010518D91|nr:hypothetical protein [Tamaricihabitans halophyticus]